ncbi:nucleotidyl transferase AbiEii/AbiGii toxin family protein [Agrobacterium tumefaciens]|uniref:nucleotidyl transferase AbiEii/AbiGii toxin family protein n=1 Tax=Agrobacterium tumefaciens TaxID=358 RepID=UPI00233F912B|nr:nucleotidyl transferase AbiEii/AbiGii toxin family protein [Agrobacterium tumefaciens]WCJ65138.1 nucleotidyl transferase AbiEii/AbiGii toxin family protein [Agrobacterium tumefaciens]
MACSKAYNAIRRFSEDVDLTYDIRELAHDLVGENDEALPKTRSEEKRWTSEVRKRLPVWLDETVSPLIVDAINAQSLPATVRIDSDKLFIDYEAVGGGSGYVAPSVMLEFGARSMGEPASVRDVSCDGAGLVDDIEFPTAKPRVMHAERTFWEKATAIHVFCLQERLRGERFSRHWHDIVRLDDIGIANSAIAARDLTKSVAQHKSMFFAEKAADRTPIDYEAAVDGGLRLTPSGEGRAALEQDYARMLEDGLLLDEAETFDELLARCEKIQDKANAGG